MADTRVAVAISGGVDSAVTAYLLKQSGHDVTGMILRLWPRSDAVQTGSEWHFPHQDLEQASRVCGYLGIPLEVVDAENAFKQKVVLPFCAAYESGKTPNPCISCNPEIKFGLLLEHALSMGMQKLATGHYAQVVQDPQGSHLFKASDAKKDQSYFLYRLSQRQLGHVIFPLGEISKSEVREIAMQAGLPVPLSHESQDICFIRKDYREFIAGHVDARPGPIVDTTGKILGQHGGIPFYTVGQRHGLGISSAEALYVIDVSKDLNRVTVGRDTERYSITLTAGNLNWIAGRKPDSPLQLMARIRYKSKEAAARLEITGSTVNVTFQQPQMAVTPGQSIVFYRDNEVIGGGIIEKTG